MPSSKLVLSKHLLRSILEVDVSKRFSVAQIKAHPWVTTRLPSTLAEGAEQRVPIPPRTFKDEDPDPDRGITVVEELDKMHTVEELRDRRLLVPLDDTIAPTQDSLGLAADGAQRVRTGSIGKRLREFFSGGSGSNSAK